MRGVCLMSLGNIIRITRKKTFYTQEDFAKKLEVALSTVNRWEQDKAKPNMKAMKAIKSLLIICLLTINHY